MSSIANSIEAIYAEMHKTAAAPEYVVTPPWDYEEYVHANPELGTLLKLAADYTRTYTSDVSIDDVLTLVYGSEEKNAGIGGRMFAGFERGLNNAAEKIYKGVDRIGEKIPDSVYRMFESPAPAAPAAPAVRMRDAAGNMVSPEEWQRSVVDFVAKAPEVRPAKMDPSIAGTAPSRAAAAGPAPASSSAGTVPTYNGSASSQTAAAGPAPGTGNAAASPPPSQAASPPPSQAAAAGPAPGTGNAAADAADDEVDLTRRNWKLPLGLATAGTVSTAGAYHYGKNKSKAEADRNRNLAFGAGLATGVAAPKIIGQAGQAMSNFGGQSASPRYY
jgi:hypothetical protein